MAVSSALAACACERVRRVLCRLYHAGQLFALVVTALAFSGAALAANLAWGEKLHAEIAFASFSSTKAAAADIHHTSENFRVRTYLGGPKALDVARHCEMICTRLRTEVFSLNAIDRWTPKCTVVIHPTRSEYLAAVGQGGSQTVGSSTVSLTAGRVRERRIDLLGTDTNRAIAAIPHELVHVLFVDALPKSPPPKWAEEGLALSFDTADKRARHQYDLKIALESRSTLPLARLLADVQYPATAHRAAFYAQSLSLVEYLMQQAPADEFVRFVKLSSERGASLALRDVYKLSPTELELAWRTHVIATRLTADLRSSRGRLLRPPVE